DQLYFDFVDGTYRGGFFGYWAWAGGQDGIIDDLSIEGQAVDACFTASPDLRLAGTPVTLDASCSGGFAGKLTSFDWDFGDGASASGQQLQHTYASSGDFQVKLTVKDDAGNTGTVQKTVSVSAPLV